MGENREFSNPFCKNRQLFILVLTKGLPNGRPPLLDPFTAAIYVAQIPEDRLPDALGEGKYLESTAEVLRRHGGLWFLDESFVGHRLPKES